MKFKQHYDSFVKKLNLTNERRLNLRDRYRELSEKWKHNLLVHLFHKGQLNSLSKSLRDIDSSFNKLSNKWSFLWGMVSNAYTIEDELYVTKYFDYVSEEINSLEKNLDKIDKRLLKYEKK